MVVAVEFPLPLKEERTAGVVVEYLEDPLKVVVVEVAAAGVMGHHNPGVEEEEEKEEKSLIAVRDDPEEDLWAA